MYNEMYFSSPEECNDPFDSKTFYEFDNDKEKWGKLIKLAFEPNKIEIPEVLLNTLVEHICNQCPLTFDDAINRDLFNGLKLNSPNEIALAKFLSLKIPTILRIYKPSTRYFVSFSEINSEPLMWSHYTDKHKGFCLIFRSINNTLNQSPNQKKRQVRRTTPNGLAPDMSHGLPEGFEFTKIDYEEEVKPLNAFLSLPVYVTGEAKNEEEKLKIFKDRESHYSQKSKSWEYESEFRLMLRPPIPFLFGEHFDFTKQERLFHYEPSQLVGIIYGARMELPEKNRIREILRERREWDIDFTKQKRIEFNFVEFEAKLSTKQRSVEVMPTGIITWQRIGVNDKNFERLYKEWQEGWGHERDGVSSKRIKVN